MRQVGLAGAGPPHLPPAAKTVAAAVAAVAAAAAAVVGWGRGNPALETPDRLRLPRGLVGLGPAVLADGEVIAKVQSVPHQAVAAEVGAGVAAAAAAAVAVAVVVAAAAAAAAAAGLVAAYYMEHIPVAGRGGKLRRGDFGTRDSHSRWEAPKYTAAVPVQQREAVRPAPEKTAPGCCGRLAERLHCYTGRVLGWTARARGRWPESWSGSVWPSGQWLAAWKPHRCCCRHRCPEAEAEAAPAQLGGGGGGGDGGRRAEAAETRLEGTAAASRGGWMIVLCGGGRLSLACPKRYMQPTVEGCIRAYSETGTLGLRASSF